MLVNRGMGGGINAGMSFFLPLGDAGSGAVNTTPVSSAGSGTPTFTRAGATAWTRNSSGAWTGPIGADVARSYYSAGGVYLGYLAEGSATNFFLNSNAVATQTITLGTGNFTCWLEGTGTITSAAGTATGTGFGAATAGSPNTINITVGGTVVYTVSGGTPTIAQVENNAFASSYIQTAGASVTRNADTLRYVTAGNLSNIAGTAYAEYAKFPAITGTGIALGSSGGAAGQLLTIASATAFTAFDGTNNPTLNAGPFVAGTVYKVAQSWGTNLAGSVNGAAAGSGAFDGDLGFSASIGILDYGGTGTFGTIRNVRIWTRQLTDAQLVGLTT